MHVSAYKPKAYIPLDNEDLDIDASNDGDYIVCPKHNDEIIYVMGTNFWHKEGGTSSFGWSNIMVSGWCYKCGKHHRISLGSYGG